MLAKMEGWIKIHRRILDWEWYDDNNVVRVFLHMLLTANFETKRWRGIIIERGQLVTSINELANDTNLTPKQTRTALEKLKSTNEIDTKGANKYTLITISKYDIYQGCENAEGQTKGEQTANKGQTEGNQRATTKEYKEYNKERNEEYYDCAEKSAPHKPKPIEERTIDFMNEIAAVGKGVYPDSMLREFFDYWSETNTNGKKMRKEMQKTFDVSKRLAKWASNADKFNFNSKKYGRNDPNDSGYVSTERIVAAGFAMAKAGI